MNDHHCKYTRYIERRPEIREVKRAQWLAQLGCAYCQDALVDAWAEHLEHLFGPVRTAETDPQLMSMARTIVGLVQSIPPEKHRALASAIVHILHTEKP